MKKSVTSFLPKTGYLEKSWPLQDVLNLDSMTLVLISFWKVIYKDKPNDTLHQSSSCLVSCAIEHLLIRGAPLPFSSVNHLPYSPSASLRASQNLSWLLALSLLTPFLLGNLSTSIVFLINLRDIISTLISLLNIRSSSPTILCPTGSEFSSSNAACVLFLPTAVCYPPLSKVTSNWLHSAVSWLTTPQVFLDTRLEDTSRRSKSCSWLHCWSFLFLIHPVGLDIIISHTHGWLQSFPQWAPSLPSSLSNNLACHQLISLSRTLFSIDCYYTTFKFFTPSPMPRAYLGYFAWQARSPQPNINPVLPHFSWIQSFYCNFFSKVCHK